MTDQRQIIDDELFAHFITINVFHRRRLLDHDHPKRILLAVLNAELNAFEAKCAGFVIMPDHAHAIVWFPKPDCLSKFLHAWKRKSSFYIRNWYRQEAPNYCRDFGEGDRFWQPKYHSFEIKERAKLIEKLKYMHANPVRAGLVARAEDWKWSSPQWYEFGRSVGVKISDIM